MNDKKLTPQERKRRRQLLLRKRTSKIYTKVAIVFLSCLLLAGAANLLHKDRDYSETENRMLAQKAEFSVKNLASGEYMTDMEAYITDQFVGRDSWIRMKTAVDRLIGKRESNGVYIGSQDHLMEIPEKPDMQMVDKNLAAIKGLAGRYKEINTVMALVPNAAYICGQFLPSHAPVRDQSADITYVKETLGDSLTYVDLTETMASHKTEELYYKTDHHWTSLAARYAFETLSGTLGIADPVSEYTVYPVTHEFQGTLSSKTGYNKAEDTIEIYIPQSDNSEYVVNYVEEGKKSATIYDSSALEQKDKYEVFFGGNHSRIDIRTLLNDKKNLLVFKDSYANCFLQFLIPYYRNIIIIDPRYYYEDVDRLITDNEITDILFLYNVNTFMGDTSLADVLASEQEG
ncbi:MAG: DHHW family protein [Eubacteriales bacterium]|nr:DHHW family protein [Eubacteriales bacterium]